MSNKLVCLAIFEAKTGRKDELAALLNSLVEPTRNEPGCVTYQLHQSQDNENRFIFYEIFADRAAFETHLAMNYFQAFKHKISELLVKPCEASIWNLFNE